MKQILVTLLAIVFTSPIAIANNEIVEPDGVDQQLVSTIYFHIENSDVSTDNLWNEILENYGDRIENAGVLIDLAEMYLIDDNWNMAVTLSGLNVELFPESGMAWNAMGVIFELASYKQLAIKSYELALDRFENENSSFWYGNSLEKLLMLKLTIK